MSDERELARLRALVGTEDPAWSAEREERLVERILQETTRSELAQAHGEGTGEPRRGRLGWRGDLQLVSEFVVQRFRASRALRTAAVVSLIAHLAAVPALAWWLVDREEEEPLLRFDPPAAEPFTETPEPDRELAVPAEWGEALFAEESDEATLGARRLARFLLSRRGAPQAPTAAEGSAAHALAFRRRSGLLNPSSVGLADVPQDTWSSARGWQRCAWAEAAFDAYILRKELPVWWQQVEPGLRALATSTTAPADQLVADLARASLRRGAAYGLWGEGGEPWEGAPYRSSWNAALEAVLAGGLEGVEEEAGWLPTWLAGAREREPR